MIRRTFPRNPLPRGKSHDLQKATSSKTRDKGFFSVALNPTRTTPLSRMAVGGMRMVGEGARWGKGKRGG